MAESAREFRKGLNMADSSEIAAAAQRYVARGWAVLALYGVNEHGVCQCARGLECGKNAGKHPVGRAKRSGGGWMPPMRTAEDVAARVRAGVGNLGIQTGPDSGIWVLDVDPKNSGDVRLMELITEHGPLPDTYRVRTGSGGMHYVWELPPDFTPTDSPGRLPVGLDVRGAGGQVVAPPSVTSIGAYAVEHDAPVVRAPAWLEDLIRPLPATSQMSEYQVGYESDIAVKTDDPRLAAYAQQAAERELTELRNAAPGSRGSTAFRAACSLIELSNSPWSGLTREQVWTHYAAACAEAMDAGGEFNEAEARQSWASAVRRIGDRGRPVPVAPGGGEFLPWESVGGMPPFSEGGSSASTDPFSIPLQRSSSEQTVTATSPTPDGVRSTAFAAGSSADPVEAMLGRMLTRDQLHTRPNPEPLVTGLLNLNSEAWIIGPPGGFKSFVALDLACHVASGQRWQGHNVRQVPVVYMVAEGDGGMKLREQAWEQAYGDPGNIVWLPEPVQAGRAEGWNVFIEACRRLQARFVVLDTQARVTVGLNENDARDMGVFIEAVRRLRAVTGACVLTVHHTGRNGGDARGSSALDGAQDTEIRVERPSARAMSARITTDKQKDGDDRFSVHVTMRVHDLGFDDAGRKLTSLAIAPADPFLAPQGTHQPEWFARLTENQAAILGALRDHSSDLGATQASIVRWLKERGTPLAQSSCSTALKVLYEKGLIEPINAGRFRLVEQ